MPGALARMNFCKAFGLKWYEYEAMPDHIKHEWFWLCEQLSARQRDLDHDQATFGNMTMIDVTA